MSQRAVEQILGKLLTDEKFRDGFFRNPEQAAREAGLDLSRPEVDALRRVPPGALGRLCALLDDRICRLAMGATPEPPPSTREAV